MSWTRKYLQKPIRPAPASESSVEDTSSASIGGSEHTATIPRRASRLVSATSSPSAGQVEQGPTGEVDELSASPSEAESPKRDTVSSGKHLRRTTLWQDCVQNERQQRRSVVKRQDGVVRPPGMENHWTHRTGGKPVREGTRTVRGCIGGEGTDRVFKPFYGC